MFKIKKQSFLVLFTAALVFGLLWQLTGSTPAIAQNPIPTGSVEITPTLSTGLPVVRVGGSASNPPFEYLENGQPAGFNIDLVRAVGREVGFDTQFVLTTPEQARQDLQDGKLDMIAGMAYSSSRESQFDFSVPITYASFNLYVPSNSPARTLEDVRGKKIIVQNGTVAQEYLVHERFTSQ